MQQLIRQACTTPIFPLIVYLFKFWWLELSNITEDHVIFNYLDLSSANNLPKKGWFLFEKKNEYPHKALLNGTTNL